MSVCVIDDRSGQLVLQSGIFRIRLEVAPTSRHGALGIHLGR